ncbi:spore germination protein [Dethiothermospora halolimnae]|uniref:spore germination protein n=1 Tax=Dethiothermospora halolimnae TaxID=3114390 RepID=UPI003CCB751C
MKRRKIIKEDYPIKGIKLKYQLEENIKIFKDIFKNDSTIKFRQIKSKSCSKLKCCIIFADGMTNREIINDSIVSPITNSTINHITSYKNLIDIIIDEGIISDHVERLESIEKLVEALLSGDSILLFDKVNEGVTVDTKGWKTRALDEPPTERIVRGPREGFTESIVVNTSLIRRRIKNSDLRFVFREIGKRTKTQVSICYIEGIANEKIVEEVFKRIDNIDMDSILESGYIDELIRDAPFSPFKTINYTERPDVVAGKILEGRVAILCDGTPIVLTLPFLFMEYFQVNEDYYSGYIFSSINRLLRYLAFFISTSIPAIYVALITSHQEMIPTPLLLSISSAREGVPFPTIFEALVMLLVFDLIREGGLRLPEPVGTTVSIVGALVLGEAAVSAKIVSAPIVIVTAITGITTFLIYKMTGALIIIRTIFLLLTAVLGLYGYIFGVIGVVIHLMSIRSFGIPYMINVGSINKQDLKDTAIRAPWWFMYYRPKLLSSKNAIRRPYAYKRRSK